MLHRFRIRAGLSQEELARRAGISPRAIGMLEQGQSRRPHPHTLGALAGALSLTTAERAALIAATPTTTTTSPIPAPTTTTTSPSPAPAPTPVWAPRLLAASAPPEPATLLVDREADLADVIALLVQAHPRVRLLTLVGPGGVGTTRLALAVAHALQLGDEDGVVFVELATPHDERLAPATIARALEPSEAGGGSAASCC